MDQQSWELFIEAAELGSLGKVALVRGTSQPQVSRQISQLEQRCGGRLFVRTGRGVALSELGKRILPKVRAWLAHTQALESEIQSAAAQPIGLVRLGIIPSVAHPLISTLLRSLARKHPLITLRIREGQGAQLEHWLAEGSIDMAILLRSGKPQGEALVLSQTQTYLVGARGDPLTAKPTVRFAKLKDIPMVMFCRPSLWRDQLDAIARERGIALNTQLEADSLAVQLAMVSTGAPGSLYALLGGYAIEDALKAGKIQASRVVEPVITRHVALALARTGPLTLAMRTVMHEAQRVAAVIQRQSVAVE